MGSGGCGVARGGGAAPWQGRARRNSLAGWSYQIFAEVRNLGSGAVIEPEEHLLQLRRRAVSERNTRPCAVRDSSAGRVLYGDLSGGNALRGGAAGERENRPRAESGRDGPRTGSECFSSAPTCPRPSFWCGGCSGGFIGRVARPGGTAGWGDKRRRRGVAGRYGGDAKSRRGALFPARGRHRGSCCDERVLSVAMRIAPDLLVVDYLTLLEARRTEATLRRSAASCHAFLRRLTGLGSPWWRFPR